MKESLEELARDVIALLDLQREYFRERGNDLLVAAKAAESRMRKRCQAIVDKTASPPSLFDQVNAGGGL